MDSAPAVLTVMIVGTAAMTYLKLDVLPQLQQIAPVQQQGIISAVTHKFIMALVLVIHLAVTVISSAFLLVIVVVMSLILDASSQASYLLPLMDHVLQSIKLVVSHQLITHAWAIQVTVTVMHSVTIMVTAAMILLTLAVTVFKVLVPHITTHAALMRT